MFTKHEPTSKIRQNRKTIFSDSLNPTFRSSGVYSIINRNNGKIYIGSAVNLSKRFSSHRFYFGTKHHNQYLERAFVKEPESFEFSVVEEVKNKSLLIEREQFWIDFYKSYMPENGYNIAPIAGSCIGVKHTPESIKRMSDCQKGKKQSLETIRKRIDSLRRNMSLGITKRNPVSLEGRMRMRMAQIGKKRSPEHIKNVIEARRIKKSNWVPVIQISLDGTEIAKFDSIKSALKSLGLKWGNITMVLRGKRKKAHGYDWKYA